MEGIKALLRKAERDLDDLVPLYEGSLRDKEVSPDLAVHIKNVLENQRSALDYLAHDLVSRYGKMTPKTKVYFPIVQDPAGFSQSITRRDGPLHRH